MQIDLSGLPDNTNDKYVPLYKDSHRYLVLYGSAASGKSYFIAQKIIYRILTEENHRILVIRKVARTLRHSVFQSIIDILSSWKILPLFKVNKSDMVISYEHTNSAIVFLGLDDREKIKSIAGITSVFIEEATELNDEDFHQIDLRLRGETKYYKQIILAFNPISVTNWNKKHWFDEPKPDSLVVKTTYLDNKYIDEQYKKVLEQLKHTNYDLYKVYALGEWGVLKGVIYPDITIVDEMPDDLENEGIGVDWGFVDPSVVVRGGIKGNNVYFDEILHRKGMITSEIMKYLPKETYIYADSAERDRIEECRRAGLWIEGAVKEVINGINRMKSYNIHITRRSANLIRDFQTYSWKQDKEGNELEVPDHFHSDGCFSGDTLVDINGEVMRFDEIPRVGKIMGVNGEYVEYVNGGLIKYDTVFSIKTKDGIVIKATPDHKFLTMNGWVPAHKLAGEVLCTSELYQKINKSLTEKSSKNIKGITTFAGKNTLQEENIQIHSVQTTVNPPIDEKSEQTMKRENVYNVVKNSQSINIQKQNTVVEVVQQKHNGKGGVYCVTVPSDGCFSLANGIVVSNCDSARYYLHTATQKKVQPETFRLNGLY